MISVSRSKKHLTALITGAGAPGIRGTLYELRSNPDRVNIRTIGEDLREEVVGRYLVEHFYKVPRAEDPQYLDSIEEICKRESVDIILPQTNGELIPLSNA